MLPALELKINGTVHSLVTRVIGGGRGSYWLAGGRGHGQRKVRLGKAHRFAHLRMCGAMFGSRCCCQGIAYELAPWP